MLCRWCGADNPVHSEACLNCGQGLQQPTDGAAKAGSAPPAAPAATPSPDLYALAIDSFNRAQPSPAEPRISLKVLPVIAGLAALLALMSGGTYYFTRRGIDIAEIAEIHQTHTHPSPAALSVEYSTASPPPETPAATLPGLTATLSTSAFSSPAADQATASAAAVSSGLPNKSGQVEPKTGIAKKSAAAIQPRTKRSTRQISSLKTKPVKPESTPDYEAESKAEFQPDAEPEFKPEFKGEFKGLFGQVVETRTYPSRKMRREAQELWHRERKILEPDGAINEKYLIAPSSPSPIPGH